MTTATARGIHRRLTIDATPEFVTCDNPPCVNHEHLFIGTYADADTNHVRELWVQGWSHREVVAITGFARGFVQKVLSGEAWSHVETLRAEVESRRRECGFINRGARKSEAA